MRLFRDADDAWGLARGLDTLGELARWLEEDAQAEALYVASMALYWRMGDDRGLAINLLNRAGLALKRGDPRQASGFLQETGSLCRRLRWEIGLAYCLVGLGAVATLQEQSERAIRLFGAVEALFNNRGHRMQPADRALYDGHLVLARARLDATEGAAAWAVVPPRPVPGSWPRSVPERELQVLVAIGSTGHRIVEGYRTVVEVTAALCGCKRGRGSAFPRLGPGGA